MKKKNNSKTRENNIVLFLQFFIVLLFGFCLCNVCRIAISCIFNGFDLFLTQVMDLPYVLYLVLSVILSAVWIFIIRSKLK